MRRNRRVFPKEFKAKVAVAAVRGDNVSPSKYSCETHGSPPRAWGQRSSLFSIFVSFRFTPTCVGTTGRQKRMPLRLTVHPHVRGDNV